MKHGQSPVTMGGRGRGKRWWGLGGGGGVGKIKNDDEVEGCRGIMWRGTSLFWTWSVEMVKFCGQALIIVGK